MANFWSISRILLLIYSYLYWVYCVSDNTQDIKSRQNRLCQINLRERERGGEGGDGERKGEGERGRELGERGGRRGRRWGEGGMEGKERERGGGGRWGEGGS